MLTRSVIKQMFNPLLWTQYTILCVIKNTGEGNRIPAIKGLFLTKKQKKARRKTLR